MILLMAACLVSLSSLNISKSHSSPAPSPGVSSVLRPSSSHCPSFNKCPLNVAWTHIVKSFLHEFQNPHTTNSSGLTRSVLVPFPVTLLSKFYILTCREVNNCPSQQGDYFFLYFIFCSVFIVLFSAQLSKACFLQKSNH